MRLDASDRAERPAAWPPHCRPLASGEAQVPHAMPVPAGGCPVGPALARGPLQRLALAWPIAAATHRPSPATAPAVRLVRQPCHVPVAALARKTPQVQHQVQSAAPVGRRPAGHSPPDPASDSTAGVPTVRWPALQPGEQRHCWPWQRARPLGPAPAAAGPARAAPPAPGRTTRPQPSPAPAREPAPPAALASAARQYLRPESRPSRLPCRASALPVPRVPEPPWTPDGHPDHAASC